MQNESFKTVAYTSKALAPVFINELLSLDKRDLVKTVAAIRLLEEYGNMIPRSMSKKLTGDIFELRITGDKKEIRILYAFRAGRIILLLSCFVKKTQKTPLNEIATAKARLKEYSN
jgi:phage-related protein